jgi:hypothetical protein
MKTEKNRRKSFSADLVCSLQFFSYSLFFLFFHVEYTKCFQYGQGNHGLGSKTILYGNCSGNIPSCNWYFVCCIAVSFHCYYYFSRKIRDFSLLDQTKMDSLKSQLGKKIEKITWGNRLLDHKYKTIFKLKKIWEKLIDCWDMKIEKNWGNNVGK